MATTLTLDHWVEADRQVFKHREKSIHGALKGETGIIDGVKEENREEVFYMLLFCLCVPQSKAIKAEEAIDLLREKDYYNSNLTDTQVVDALITRVRFHNTKSRRLIEAKESFSTYWTNLQGYFRRYQENTPQYSQVKVLRDARQYIIRAINGMGMKLASHFLRNIGMSGLAILDVHVLDGLKKRGVIPDENLTLSRDAYCNLEQKFFGYAKQVGLSPDELDLLLWSEKTGYVFK